MAPLFNTTAVCNTTEACARVLNVTLMRLDDFQRLSYILASLFGIMLLLFILSPLIFNLPKERPDFTRSAPDPSGNESIQMHVLENREAPEPEFIIGDSDEEEEVDEPPRTNQSSQSTLSDPSRFRQVSIDGETFHVARSDQDVTRLAQTRVFHGAGDEQDLAQRCVDKAQPTSTSSSPVLPSRSYRSGDEGGRRGSTDSRIGTAVSV